MPDIPEHELAALRAEVTGLRGDLRETQAQLLAAISLLLDICAKVAPDVTRESILEKLDTVRVRKYEAILMAIGDRFPEVAESIDPAFFRNLFQGPDA